MHNRSCVQKLAASSDYSYPSMQSQLDSHTIAGVTKWDLKDESPQDDECKSLHWHMYGGCYAHLTYFRQMQMI